MIEIGGRTYEIRPFREADEDAVVELHELVFGEKGERARRDRDWRGRRNPAGHHRTSVCYTGEGRLVCAYTSIPLRARVVGDPTRFALVVDTMTHPDFRGAVLGRRGLLVRTALHWLDHHVGPDTALAFGVPEERNAALGARLLGYRLWDDLRRYTRGIRDSIIKRARRGIGIPGVIEVGEVGPEADRLWSRVEVDYPTAVVRDRRYLSWRYRAGPTRDYVLLASGSGDEWTGWLVVAARGDLCTIVDGIVPADDRVADALLYAAIGRGLDLGATTMTGWAMADSPLGRLLESAGFWRGPAEGLPFACRIFADIPEDAIRSSLYVQPGDTDEI